MDKVMQSKKAVLLVLGGVALAALAAVLRGVVLLGSQGWGSLLLNLGTEMAGVVGAYFLFEMVLGGMRRREARKMRLITQMGSPESSLAKEAAQSLRSDGWLYDGSLQEANLVGANLRGADLSKASLGKADLRYGELNDANLSEADLRGANLGKADLSGANLHGADLRGANLREASLAGADLLGANLARADLSGADLNAANLLQADLSGVVLEDAYVSNERLAQARSLKGATLPDGTKHD
jgi:hypothetical protein